MSELKPFYVTLTYSGVVMADSHGDAERVAYRYSRDIVSDEGDPVYDDVIELQSLAHLRKVNPGWDGECCTYGGGGPRLRDVLPEESPPERDTKTVDMFGPGAAA